MAAIQRPNGREPSGTEEAYRPVLVWEQNRLDAAPVTSKRSLRTQRTSAASTSPHTSMETTKWDAHEPYTCHFSCCSPGRCLQSRCLTLADNGELAVVGQATHSKTKLLDSSAGAPRLTGSSLLVPRPIRDCKAALPSEFGRLSRKEVIMNTHTPKLLAALMKIVIKLFW